MNRRDLLVSASSVLLLAACGSKTERAALEPAGPGRQVVMLSNPGQLQPGGPGQPALRYVNPRAPWASYTKLIIQPVTFWGSASSPANAAAQQNLSNYLYNAMVTALGREIQLVNRPGPNTMVLRVALTDITSSDPTLRTISVVVPQARLLSLAGSELTGEQAFAGSAQGEGEITDSLTGERLAAFVDRRQGGSSVETAGGGSFADAKAIMDYWANLMATRLQQLRSA
jgi:hypothetical protein